jgi:hypothetical protein
MRTSQAGLQYAMWAVAASLSSQFQHLRDSVYRKSRQILETIELNDTKMESIDIEQAQAWILISIYEFTRMYYRRGWMSAGRAFRLVQLMGLYEIDGIETSARRRVAEPTSLSWPETEERRRTFWMAYCIDRLVSIRNRSPLTIGESVVS